MPQGPSTAAGPAAADPAPDSAAAGQPFPGRSWLVCQFVSGVNQDKVKLHPLSLCKSLASMCCLAKVSTSKSASFQESVWLAHAAAWLHCWMPGPWPMPNMILLSRFTMAAKGLDDLGAVQVQSSAPPRSQPAQEHLAIR